MPSMYKKKKFEELISIAQSGDMYALEELIKKIQKNVYTMFNYLSENKQDTSDLTQEALIKAAKGLHNLHDPKCFKSWLSQIVTNVFYDYIKKHASDKNIEFDESKLLKIRDKIGCEPGEKCIFSEIDKIIKSALLGLPENLRIVIILREYEGLSYDEISKITNTAIGTVKSRIARARNKLQYMLKDFI